MAVGVCGTQFVQNRFGVARDLGVDFAARDVFTQRRDQLGERAVGFADDVSQRENCEGRTLGIEVVLEVVVAAQLTGEERVVFAHLLLDEGVADAAHHRGAACGFDRLFDNPTAAQVIEDHTFAFGQHVLCDQRGDEIHRDDLAALVNEAGTVGVAIVSHAKGVFTGAHLGLQVGERGVIERVGLVVREASVRIFVQTVPRQHALQRLDLPDAHAVGEVDRQMYRLRQLRELRHMATVRLLDIGLADCSRGRGFGREAAFVHDALDLLDAGSAADRHGLCAAQLEAIPLGGIVRGGNHDAGVRAQRAVGEVGHRCGTVADVNDVGALFGQTFGQRGEQRFRVGADVARHDHLFAGGEGHKGATDRVRGLFSQIFSVNTADVVCFVNICHGELLYFLVLTIEALAKPFVAWASRP